MKAHLEDRGDSYLPDGILHSWLPRPGRQAGAAPASRNTQPARRCSSTPSGSWPDRPEARTKVPNLFLAGDYVRSDIDLATMEGANETGRAAVAALLDAAGLERRRRRRCTSSTTRPSSRPSRRSIASCYRQGLPNALDIG